MKKILRDWVCEESDLREGFMARVFSKKIAPPGGYGFGVPGSVSTFRVPGFGVGVPGFEFRILGFGFRLSGFRVSGFGCRRSCVGFRVSGFGLKAPQASALGHGCGRDYKSGFDSGIFGARVNAENREAGPPK